jgi:ribosomal protein L11 methyltransferase
MNYAAPASPSGMTATLVTDEQSARRIADCFVDGEFADDVAAGLVDDGAGQWRVTLYFRGPMDEGVVRDLTISAAGLAAADALSFAFIARKDWVVESLLGLPPVAAGRFVVHGAHDRGRAPLNRIGIEIEAAQAFGTGHHPTTRGCLLALDGICKSLSKSMRARTPPSPWKGEGWGGGQRSRGWNATPTRRAFARRPPPFRGRSSGVLDLGTGSGVLAIATARSLQRRVLATDIDALAVRIARDNARLNRAGSLVRVYRATGVALPELRVGAPFDLVFANILLAPLQKLAAPLSTIVAPGGRVVLSGVLKSQGNAVLASYRRFTLERRIELDGWTTLVLKRGSTLPWRGRVAASKQRERRGGVG